MKTSMIDTTLANVRLHAAFTRAKSGLKLQVGCYNVGVRNTKTGQEGSTQGDVHKGYTWDDFEEWLLGDMKEMDIGDMGDLTIDYIEYAGIDDPEVFADTIAA